MGDTRIVRYLDQLWLVELEIEPRSLSSLAENAPDVPAPRRILRFRVADVSMARDAPDDRELNEFSDEELLRILHGEGSGR